MSGWLVIQRALETVSFEKKKEKMEGTTNEAKMRHCSLYLY
jgi:hypothetical protein